MYAIVVGSSAARLAFASTAAGSQLELCGVGASSCASRISRPPPLPCASASARRPPPRLPVPRGERLARAAGHGLAGAGLDAVARDAQVHRERALRRALAGG